MLLDLKTYDRQLYTGYQAMLNPDIDLEALCLDEETFTTQVEKFGEPKIIELVPHGAALRVTKENITEWVNAIRLRFSTPPPFFPFS